MELYKERGINPLASFPTLIIQFIVLIGLYSGLRKVIDDPHSIVTFAYGGLQHLSWMQHLAHHPSDFDDTLFGLVNLKRAALGSGAVYWPAMVLVLASAITQYYQSKQLMPANKDSRSLRQILREAGEGKRSDSSEVNAAVGRTTRFFIPVMIFLFTVRLASALSLYWFVGGLVAFIQQSIVLREDEEEMEAMADKPGKNADKIPEAEIVDPAPKKPKQKSKKSRKKRRKK
jgi:membrane protein insertase Oxa1/YidC/SpoIIIJ